MQPVRMHKLKFILTLLFGAFMVFAGINHFLKQEMYYPFIPDFLPKALINCLSGIVEILLGLGILHPNLRSRCTLGIFWLMLLFLPLHIWDVFRTHPAIGNHTLALLRLPAQFILILWAWFISRKNKKLAN
jgi:uncharacterized membrane protein